MGDIRHWASRLVLLLTFVGCLAPSSATAQETGSVMPAVRTTKDTKLVYRLDLMSGKLDPLNRADLKVGYTYYHFSPRRNAWSWSYLQKDGNFWYAFGEGTTQEAWSFDVRDSREEIAKRLEEFPELARQMDRYNQSVCLRLQADGRWKVVGTGRVPSIYNADTGERWQMSSRDKYIPVVHTYGAIWTVRNGTYDPSNSSFVGQ